MLVTEDVRMLAMEAVRLGWCAIAGSSGEGTRGAALSGALRAGDEAGALLCLLALLLTLLILLSTRLMLALLSRPTPPACVLESRRITSLLAAPSLRRACCSESLFSGGGE